MKQCRCCGALIADDAVACSKCGYALEPRYSSSVASVSKDDSLDSPIRVFMIVGCVVFGLLIFPLAWCLPMTVKVFKKLKKKEPISTGLMVCVLLFVNPVAGALLLIRDDRVNRIQ